MEVIVPVFTLVAFPREDGGFDGQDAGRFFLFIYTSTVSFSSGSQMPIFLFKKSWKIFAYIHAFSLVSVMSKCL